jgi:hypothetical protein
MRSLRGCILVTLLTTALAVTGPGVAYGAPRSDGRRIDPCDLLSSRDIREVTGWRMPRKGERVLYRTKQKTVCNYTEPAHAGVVQVQLHEGGGKRAFARQRVAAHRLGLGRGELVDVRSATSAYEIPAHGIVGLLVHDHFVQVVTLGDRVRDRQQRRIAAIVARNLR